MTPGLPLLHGGVHTGNSVLDLGLGLAPLILVLIGIVLVVLLTPSRRSATRDETERSARGDEPV